MELRQDCLRIKITNIQDADEDYTLSLDDKLRKISKTVCMTTLQSSEPVDGYVVVTTIPNSMINQLHMDKH